MTYLAYVDIDQLAKVVGFITSAVLVLSALIGFVWYVIAGRKNIKLKDVAEESQALASVRAEKIKDLREEVDGLRREVGQVRANEKECREELKSMTSLYLKAEGRQTLLEEQFGLVYDEVTHTYKKIR